MGMFTLTMTTSSYIRQAARATSTSLEEKLPLGLTFIH